MRTDYIKPSVYLKIYQLMQYENALALRLSLETGLRISDVLCLEKTQLRGQTVQFTAQKTGKDGKKVISADLAKRLRQVSGKRWIFTGRFGNKPRTRQAVWKDVKKACRALSITENVACHSARKTYAVELFHDKGLPAVEKELQHDRVSTTMLYAFSDLITDRKHTAEFAPDEKNKPTDTVGLQPQDVVEFAELVADIVVKRLDERTPTRRPLP